ncbi:phenylalanine 4-monooxygenase [Corallincola spongiicola]|uniref:Phenylalanine-4-hydroxylase n=1 Tax=Corallincola spongiicola TaxID=2520508 RepID=A0ABY1WTU9_9GAMM|nr:phenylalanine 4-monooxygenase [Corallincola spongiicola]TAA47947.1 phenylalanine 4-monooxygenase [Corallincola spongiicola]
MKQCRYVSKQADSDGLIIWSDEEHQVWHDLITQQQAVMPGKACDEYLKGMEALALPTDRIPQLDEINRVLIATSGWQVVAVPALIPFEKFFQLLANKQFPVATFIRSREEFAYLQEPDIFHEIVGHCPLLTNPAFAHFTHRYGQIGLAATPQQRVYLARLYWFTVEFGLVNTDEGLRIYGGGILSSPGETERALHSPDPERLPLKILDAMRTPYRIDIMQPVYYVLDDIDELVEIAEMNLIAKVDRAQKQGLFPPRFAPVAQ